MQGRHSHRKPYWATCPTLEISCQVHGVRGTVSVQLGAFPPTHSTVSFPGGHTSDQVSHPCKGRLPSEAPRTWRLDGVSATVQRQVERALAMQPTPRTGSPVGVRPVLLLGG